MIKEVVLLVGIEVDFLHSPGVRKTSRSTFAFVTGEKESENM